MTMAASSPYADPLNRAAGILRNIAGLEARLGDRSSAERDFRKTIEITLQAFPRSEKNWNADRKDIRPLGVMVFEERRIAEILQRLDQPADALGYWSKALEHARIRFAADTKNATFTNDLQAVVRAIERLQWEKSGEMGDYRRVVGPDLMEVAAAGATLVPLTLPGLRADIASAYLTVGERLDFDGDLERTRAAALKALEMYEALLREPPNDQKQQANSKRGIAQSLKCLATGNLLMARRTSGEERRRNLQEASHYLARANALMKDVEAGHQLSSDYIDVPGQIAVELATVEAWLDEPAQIVAAH